MDISDGEYVWHAFLSSLLRFLTVSLVFLNGHHFASTLSLRISLSDTLRSLTPRAPYCNARGHLLAVSSLFSFLRTLIDTIILTYIHIHSSEVKSSPLPGLAELCFTVLWDHYAILHVSISLLSLTVWREAFRFAMLQYCHRVVVLLDICYLLTQ